MKLVIYELRKLCGAKHIIIFTLILLVLNSLFIVYETNGSNAKVPADAAKAFIGFYRDDPDAVMEDYEKRQAAWEEIHKLEDEMFMDGLSYEYEPPENKYSSSEDYSDDDLYLILNDLLNKTSGYRDTVGDVINRAENNLKEFDLLGISKEEYSYRYQLRVIELYEKAKNDVRFGFEYVHGWNEYFNYSAVNIFIFIVIIIAGTVIFAQEKVSGALPIIRATKEGRFKTAIAKLTAIIAVTIFTVVLFTTTTLLTFWLCCGFSSLQNAIQILDAYELSPYILTIGEYLALTFAVKIVTFTLFSAAVVLVSVFTYNYVITYIAGLGFYGINYLLNSISYIGVEGAFGALNLVAAANVTPLTERYRAINLFGHTADYVSVMFVLYAILSVSLFVLSAHKYVRSGEGKSWRFITVMSQHIKEKITTLKTSVSNLKRQRSYPKSIFAYEMHKLIISSRLWILIILFLFIKIYATTIEYRNTESYSDAIYKSYMVKLDGELTDEKRQYIREERELISKAFEMEVQMRSAYFKGEIELEEFLSYLERLNYAKGHDEVLLRVEEHEEYIIEKALQGYDVHFLYDTGWKELFFGRFDPLLYGLILIAFSGIFANEYESRSSSGSFSQILRLTKHGRKKTFTAKLAATIIFSGIISIVWSIIDILIVSTVYELPSLFSPLLSISAFENLPANLSILGFLIFVYTARTLSLVLLAVWVLSFSLLFKSSLITVSTVGAITLLPSILSYFGVIAVSALDYISFMIVTPIVIDGMMPFIIFAAVITILVSIMVVSAKRKWCH